MQEERDQKALLKANKPKMNVDISNRFETLEA